MKGWLSWMFEKELSDDQCDVEAANEPQWQYLPSLVSRAAGELGRKMRRC